MKRNVLFSTMILLAGSALAADSAPKNEVKGAAKKLADAGSYSWKSTVEAGGGAGGGGGGRGRGGFGGGPTEGKIGKDGIAVLKMTRGENTTEAVMKGEKGAVKTQEGWQSLSDLTAAGGGGGGGRRGGGFVAFALRSFKAPAAQAEDLIAKAKELKMADGAYSGDLTEEGVKALLSFGGGRGGQGPEISGAKGFVKFWVKDGVLSKYQFKVQGTMSFNGNDIPLDRTTTVDINDVGATKVEVPEEAKKKLS